MYTCSYIPSSISCVRVLPAIITEYLYYLNPIFATTKGYNCKISKIADISSDNIKIDKKVELNTNAVIEKNTFPCDMMIEGDDCRIGSLRYIAHGVQLGKKV